MKTVHIVTLSVTVLLSVVSCHILGFNYKSVKAPRCPKFRGVKHGRVEVKTYASLSCRDGYSMVGFVNTMVCQRNRRGRKVKWTWQGGLGCCVKNTPAPTSTTNKTPSTTTTTRTTTTTEAPFPTSKTTSNPAIIQSSTNSFTTAFTYDTSSSVTDTSRSQVSTITVPTVVTINNSTIDIQSSATTIDDLIINNTISEVISSTFITIDDAVSDFTPSTATIEESITTIDGPSDPLSQNNVTLINPTVFPVKSSSFTNDVTGLVTGTILTSTEDENQTERTLALSQEVP